MRVLVTGGVGFIGSHLKIELEKRGYTVIVCDPKEYRDIRYISTEDLTSVNTVFHLGAASGSLHFKPNPTKGVDINCVGTVNLLECCKQAKVRKVIFASTGSSYSGTPLPHKEENTLNVPNFYTATKIFDEMIMKLYHDLYGVETVIFRYASVYGDGEDKKENLANVISQFIWKMVKGERPEVWSTGNQTRDFIFVDDIVSANIFAMERLNHGIYNVGTGIETKFIDVIRLISKNLGTDIRPVFVEERLGDVQKQYVDRQLFDVSKLIERGWKSSVTVEEGIRKIIDNIKKREK